MPSDVNAYDTVGDATASYELVPYRSDCPSLALGRATVFVIVRVLPDTAVETPVPPAIVTEESEATAV